MALQYYIPIKELNLAKFLKRSNLRSFHVTLPQAKQIYSSRKKYTQKVWKSLYEPVKGVKMLLIVHYKYFV